MIFCPTSTSRGKAPIPVKLPGQFFALEFDRDDRSYVLHVDDEGRSTFALGEDVDQVVRVFTSRGFPITTVNEMIDRTREFGACQYIPSQFEHLNDRIIQLPPRTAKHQPLRLFEEPTDGTWNHLR